MSIILSHSDNRPHVHGYDTLLRGFERVKSFVDQKGLRMSAGCRLEHYSRTLTRLAGPLDGPAQIVAITKLVGELHQVISIVDWLGDDPDLLKDFEFLFGGIPDDFRPPEKDPARDRQFQLYVAASLKRAGAGIRLAEPDIVAEITGRTIPIAVKRPKSVNGARRLIRAGREQVQKFGSPGIIALDLSLFPIEGQLLYVLADNPAQVPRVANDVLVHLLHRVGNRFITAVGGPKYAPTVAGCLYFINVPVQIERPWIGTAGRAWAMQPINPDFQNMSAQIVTALSQQEMAVQTEYGKATPPGGFAL